MSCKKRDKNMKETTENQQAEQQTENVSAEEQNAKETETQENDSAEMAKDETNWQQKFEDLNNAHLRLMADFDNFRKRNIKEKAELIKNASERVITDLLPVVDNFERALKSLEGTEQCEGVKMIYDQLMGIMKSNGVELIETEGLELNTDLHDAITTIPAPTEELKGKIVDCIKKGYTMNGKVIRHSQVVVGN